MRQERMNRMLDRYLLHRWTLANAGTVTIVGAVIGAVAWLKRTIR